MQRAATITKAVLAGLTAVGLAACSPGLGGDETPESGDAPAASTAPEPAPGRFTGLPEPCGAVPPETLRELLPGGAEEDYAGRSRVTYDTGRRVGCSWGTADGAETYRLTVDLLRVVSYDPAVSDEAQAEEDFGERAADAGVPAQPPADGATGPRMLDGVGQAAFLDDRLIASDGGPAREIDLTFRTANVIVAVKYAVATSTPDAVPESGLLQQRAGGVARRLAEGLDA
ncbi:DUF3558 family protein [Streptomyces avicenniae]|uniref:DUF3558 family protein n=1 Tax=Streptomyces avicenniae TaxID=500153 RepID=UPI00069B5F0F|nr:DUF3558 family protein [Streptomyces avicenniae]